MYGFSALPFHNLRGQQEALLDKILSLCDICYQLGTWEKSSQMLCSEGVYTPEILVEAFDHKRAKDTAFYKRSTSY
jgi:hypothetical protein